MKWFLYFMLFILVWCILPFVMVAYRVIRKEIPKEEMLPVFKCFLQVSMRNLYVLPFELAAPIMVPIAVLHTKWEADELPEVFKFWDNDVSLNGDHRNGDGTVMYIPIEDTPEVRELTYWAKGHHPRSKYARIRWLLRNRCGHLNNMLGFEFTPGGVFTQWSNRNSVREKGWTLFKYVNNEGVPAYIYREDRLKIIKGRTFNLYTKFGWKVWDNEGYRKVAPLAFGSLGLTIRK